MKIYSKTGDEGRTGLVGGGRVPKHDARIEALGDVDELNAALGVCRTHAQGTELDQPLGQAQDLLFQIGAELATPQGGRFVNETLEQAHVEKLEEQIDAYSAELEPLRNFVLPGGSPLGARLHWARAVCRRAERSVARLAQEAEVREVVLAFLNRLSDWLFVLARTANKLSGVQDKKWLPEGN